MGYSIAFIGDINGDGRSDYIVGASHASPSGKTTAGTVYVISGADGTVIYQINGGNAGDHFGYSVAGLGDVDGDGVPDFIVGAPSTAVGGSAYVYSGATGALIRQHDATGEAGAGQFGFAVGSAGDINTDGRADYIIGAPSSSIAIGATGSAFVYSGLDGTRIYRVDGQNTNDFMGCSVAGGGDIDGDGIADFVVGAMFANGPSNASGNVWVFSGATGSVIYRLMGPSDNFQLGSSVSMAGDVDGDGRADFVVGAQAATATGAGRGVVRVYSGATGTVIHEWVGVTSSDLLGLTVCSAGDVDNDGYADVVAGFMVSSLTSGGGRFQVYSGADGGLLYDIFGQNGEEIGQAVAGGGDGNGDGNSDFLAGAPNATVGGVANSGTAYLFTSSGQVGIIPSESMTPFSLTGYDAVNIPAVAPNSAKSFAGSGGSPPYTWTLLTNLSGSTLDASGNYTAGATSGVYDTIRVTDSVGQSHDTRVLVKSGGLSPATSGRPTTVQAILTAPDQINLSWVNRSPAGTGLFIEMRTPTNPWVPGPNVPVASSSQLITGLDPTKMYLFRIKSSGASGDSLWSPIAETSLPPPVGLTSPISTSSSVSLTWMSQSTAQTGFEIQYRVNDPNASWLSAGIVAGDVTTFAVTGLSNGTAYTFRVRALTGVLQTAWSASITAATLP